MSSNSQPPYSDDDGVSLSLTDPNHNPSTSTINNPLITLHVSTQTFTTHATTITSQSHFFTRLLSSPPSSSNGSYFLDASPQTFQHILSYLRSGIFPFFYAKETGFDYSLYAAILQQALHFGIVKLASWISNENYLQAVKVIREVRVVDDLAEMREMREGLDVEVEYHLRFLTRKVYVCPRELSVHRGNPRACGKLCRNARGKEGEDVYVDEEVVRVVVVRKRMSVDWRVLGADV